MSCQYCGGESCGGSGGGPGMCGKRRIDSGERRVPEGTGRYELLHDDERFKLRAGDVLVCGRMHWAWAPEKVAVLFRESDGYEPGCSQYRGSVRFLSGKMV